VGIKALFGKDMAGLWTRNLIITTFAVFLMRFGEGLLGGARMNFMVDTLGITGQQVLWLEGIREVPGLLLIFIAALIMRLPLSWRAAGAALILGLGYMSFALVQSYTGLLAAAIAASFGLHIYQPVGPALGLALASERTRGRVLGLLASVGSLAGIAGIGALALTSNLMRDISLRWYYVIGGAVVSLSALVFWRLSATLGATNLRQPRMVVKRRYWRFYLLKFFEGSRKEILGSFCLLVLVQFFGWEIWRISTLLLGASVLSMLISPYLGMAVDRFGAKASLAVSYTILAMAAVGYAVIPDAMILAGIYIVIRVAHILNLGLNVYAHEKAPAEELNPTLAAGVSFDHVSSVGMPFIFGAMMASTGRYAEVYWLAAILIAISVVFVLRMGSAEEPQPIPELAPAE
jgi:predicted MFS family arabinose efflux permease